MPLMAKNVVLARKHIHTDQKHFHTMLKTSSIALLVALLGLSTSSQAASGIEFNKDIRPLLAHLLLAFRSTGCLFPLPRA
jgi:hypothetical protein